VVWRPQPRLEFTTTLMGHYIPRTWLSFGLDYVLWGMQPAGYHFTNLCCTPRTRARLLDSQTLWPQRGRASPTALRAAPPWRAVLRRPSLRRIRGVGHRAAQTCFRRAVPDVRAEFSPAAGPGRAPSRGWRRVAAFAMAMLAKSSVAHATDSARRGWTAKNSAARRPGTQRRRARPGALRPGGVWLSSRRARRSWRAQQVREW